MARKLTPKQEKFAQLYVELGNASEAYRQAYPNSKMGPKAVSVNAAKLLKHTGIALVIQALGKAAASKHEITAERVIGEYAKIAFADLSDFISVDDDGNVRINFDQASKNGSLAAMQEITQDEYWDGRGEDAERVKKTKFKLHDKQRALEMIGKRMGMWIERHSIEGPGLMEFFKTLPLDLQTQVIAFYESRRTSDGSS